MIYLNREIKDLIIERALEKAGILDRKEAIRKRRAEWAEAARVDSLGGPQAVAKIDEISMRVSKDLESLPEGLATDFLAKDFLFRANIGGQFAAVYYNGEMTHARFDRQVFRPTLDRCHVIPADSDLAREFRAIEKDSEELDREARTVRESVRVALSAARTVKQLLRAWPEAAELLPEMAATKNKFPAIRREDLNALVGLPSEGAL